MVQSKLAGGMATNDPADPFARAATRPHGTTTARARSLAGRRVQGLSTVEYALLALGVIAVIAAALTLLEGGMLDLLGRVSSRMTAAAS